MPTLRKNIMIGTAGHVDHGKTALVKMLTGCETDTLAEEKQRGLTIDLGFAPCRLRGDRIVGLVDVPGHIDFIRNMVAGAHGIDLVILVVAADDGIMPQTQEHLHILTLMGIQHGIVALTKIDLVDAPRREFVMQDLRRLLAGTFLEQAPICPLSNINGEGFGEFFDTLNQAVDQCEERASTGIFRVWVEDAFSIRGSGTVITGIPTRGTVRVGDRVVLLPSELPGHVRRMQVYGEDAESGRAGECVALNIPEIDYQTVQRGQVLAEPGFLAPVSMAEGELQILAAIHEPIKDYTEVQLHVGTAAVLARLAFLESTTMTGGQKQLVQLRMSEPLALAPGDRFAVRANLSASGQSGLTTVGGGCILAISNVRLRRKKPWTLEMLQARRDALGDPERWCELMLCESGQPQTPAALQSKCLLRAPELGALLERLCATGCIERTPTGEYVGRSVLQQVEVKILSALQAFHEANPERTGMERAELLPFAGGNTSLCERALGSLLETKQIEQQGMVFARTGWVSRVSDPEQCLREQVAAAFQNAGWAVPTVPELAAALRELPAKVEKAVKVLAERGTIIRIDPQLCLHTQAVESAKQIVLRLFAQAPSFSTMQFRDALGVSRKYAVPLLDYLDKIRFTVRNGNNRTPGFEAKKLLQK